MRVGQTLAGNLVASHTFHYFTVPLQAGTHYRIEVLLDSLDDSVLTLFDPDGREVASNDDFSNASHASRIDYPAATSGTYTVKVAGSGAGTGSYRLKIDSFPSTPMGVGQALAGNLAVSHTFDYFTVHLQAGTHYRIEVLLDSLDDSVLTLFGPDGRDVASNDDFNDASHASRIDFIPVTSGTYTIKVAGYGTSTGSYRLRIDAVPSIPMGVGQTLAGNLVASNTFDHFTVSLQADTHYRVEVLLDSLDDSVLTLFGPDGREVASNDDFSEASYASRIDYTAATSGTYTIRVAGYGTSTGSYRLRIDAVPSTPMGVGQTLAGNLVASNTFDHFTVPFQADMHDCIEVPLNR